MTSPTPPPGFRVRHVLVSLFVLSSASISLAQEAAAPAPEKPKPEEDVILLTPFVVDSTKDKGYFAENTLAGSRMNTNLSDLGASISVITKQQLEDTASLDINDVFRYEINTEGSSTYTPAVAAFRNDGPLDVIAGGTQGNAVASFTNATANRIRGIGVPSTAINNYPSIADVPMDTYNVQRLEISRGPNSMLFGMGSPAGVVNQSNTQAVLNRDTNKVTLRGDHMGGFRTSLALNRSLIDDKLAVYAAFLYNDEQFERKPSYDKTKRAFGAVTFKPFSKTVIRANVEDYTNDNRRPNSITPRDFVTEWRLAGQPVYDSATKKITITSTGEVKGPYIIAAGHPQAQEVRSYITGRTNFNPALRGGAPAGQTLSNSNFSTYNGVSIFGTAALTNTSSALFVPTLFQVNQARTYMQIADGQLVNWFQPLHGQRYRTAWGTPTNPSAAQAIPPEGPILANPVHAEIYNRDYLAAGGRPVANTLSNYRYPGVTDKSVYDWENLNINQMNFGHAHNTTYNVDIEQEILSNLYFNAGWFRQSYESATNYTLAQLNSAALFVDVNLRLPDGSMNPFFGKPYVEDSDPDRYKHSQDNDSYRAMLAYTPDFTQQKGLLKWLGRHQILGLWSQDRSNMVNTRQRLYYVAAQDGPAQYRFLNNQRANADGSPSGWSYQSTSLRRAYYLASPQDPFNSSVTQTSGEWNPLSYNGNVRVYNYQASKFEDLNVTTAFTDFDSPSRNQRVVDSISAGITSHLWNERLVTTFGVRRDDYKARTNTTGAFTDEAGVSHVALTPQEKWVNGVLQTETILDRFNIWNKLSGTTRTAGGVLRPFKNWNRIDTRANSGSVFWQFVRDFGFSYNQSDNFNPPPSPQVDAFGTFLPKPTGEGKDYGVQFSLFNDKVFARITWFEASNVNERTSPGASIGRLTGNIDTDTFRAWARTIARINMGEDPRDATSWDVEIPAGSAKDLEIQAAAEKIWKQDYNYYSSLPGQIFATRSADAEGVEAQLNYNPSKNWTIRGTFGKQDTVYSNVLTEFDAWYNHRNPVWQAAKAADYLLPQYSHLVTYVTQGGTGRRVDLTNFWSSFGYVTHIRDTDIFGNTSVARYYDNVVTPQIALSKDLEGQKAPGQRRYRGSLMTNYRFDEGRFKGFEVGGVQRWEDKMIMGYLGRASGADLTNPTRLDLSDITKPVYDDANSYTDVWIAYSRKIMNDKVGMKVQFNVANVFEDGTLRPISVDYQGTFNAFRIIDPRRYMLTATFDF